MFASTLSFWINDVQERVLSRVHDGVQCMRAYGVASEGGSTTLLVRNPVLGLLSIVANECIAGPAFRLLVINLCLASSDSRRINLPS
ncbi:hypothetical protein AKJ16_DCAP14262 [Drosera capensis]